MPYALDAIDIQILGVMQKDASLSSAELAERVGLSQSPCWRRIQRLRDEGYIKTVVAILDHTKLGYGVKIFAQLKMTRLSERDRVVFHRTIQNTPEILECWSVFGELDCLMKVLAPDVGWYQEFLFSVLMKLPGVTDVRSLMTLQEAKSTTAIPLTAPQFR